ELVCARRYRARLGVRRSRIDPRGGLPGRRTVPALVGFAPTGMVQSLSVATKPSPVAGDLSESWRVLRERYALLLVDRLRLDDPLRAVAIHALQGGKRIRPMLAELLGRALGAPQDAVADVAVAVEYLHTASVMLDDLPCMDDAVERREVPAAHVRFSEAEVILTAVALLSRSYAVLLLAPVRLEDCRGMTLLASETVAGA